MIILHTCNFWRRFLDLDLIQIFFYPNTSLSRIKSARINKPLSVLPRKYYYHVVLGVLYKGKFGAIGLSRKSSLMDKPVTFSSLFDLLVVTIYSLIVVLFNPLLALYAINAVQILIKFFFLWFRHTGKGVRWSSVYRVSWGLRAKWKTYSQTRPV